METEESSTADWKSLLEECRKLSRENEDDRRLCLLQEHLSLLQTHIQQQVPALRCAYAFVSFRNTQVTVRKQIQQLAFTAWCEGLLDILLLEQQDTSAPVGRRLAGKILTNLVTDNSDTATQLMCTYLQLEPKRGGIVEAASSAKQRNWVDLILHTRHDRLALGAVMACLHNCIVQPHLREHVVDETIRNTTQQPSLFFATLLRQLVSSDKLERDAASDWILWTVTQFSLTDVYPSIGATSTPEHVVLLLLHRMAVEEEELGRSMRPEDIVFLVELFLNLEPMTTTHGTNEERSSQQHESICHLVLEILCEDQLVCRRRQQNDEASGGQHKETWGPRVLPVLIRRMADSVDAWNTSSTVVRERRQLSADAQRWLVNCVRLVGLLCHQSTLHQDLLRKITTATTPTADVTAATDPPQQQQQQRTGLHVLLSTTSIAPACFTAREWAIVAIRYALEDNPANQAAVEALQAQGAVQSPDLNDMGVRVAMNAQGNVSVTPVDEEDSSAVEE